MSISVRELLAETVFRVDYRSLPADVIHQANRCVLDLIGVAHAGSAVGAAPLVGGVIESLGGHKEATVFGGLPKMAAPFAAMVNTVSGHSLDMDDGHRHANAHIGVVTVPPALAIAEKDNLSGQNFVESVVAGNEVMIRLCTALNPSLLNNGFHTTAVLGPFAAAAVAGKLLKLDMKKLKNAMSLSALQSSGLLEALHDGQMGKPYQVGNAVKSGILSALMAQKGIEGPDLIFEGNNGFLKAYGNLEFKQSAFDDDHAYQIKSVYFKTHAACRHIHPAIDGAMKILKREEITPDKIDAIEIETYTIAKRLVGQNTGTGSELSAKFSMPVSLGLALIQGSANPDDYNADAVQDDRVQAIADKVRVTVTAEWDDVFPAKRGAMVKIRVADRLYSQKVEYARGEPENPLSDEALLDKFAHNLDQKMSANTIDKISRMIFELPSRSIRELMSFF